jgi:DNA-binding beta-propeller fold protein YncE
MKSVASVTLLLTLTLVACSSAGGPATQTAPSAPNTSATSTAATPPAASGVPAATYWVYVGAESADQIHRIRFGPDGTKVEKTILIGEIPVEMEGPHGLQITRDGKYLIMTTGHGTPDGKIWKYHLGPDTVVGTPIFLGRFPASVDVTPDGLYAFAVNFNLHGEMEPSSVSVVYTPDITEVKQITTCTMPHGSRLDPQGLNMYSTCMMDDQLVEIDTRTFTVARRFSLAKGAEKPLDKEDMGHHAHGMKHEPSCSPTWAQPGADGSKIYVACNKSDEILEISTADWKLVRKFAAGRGPYNLAVTPDGKLLVATIKQGSNVQVFDIATGKSVGTATTSNKLAHGVVISPDSRYAFISSEGVGAQPGKVDVIDLQTYQKVGTADVGQQASGIAFWKMQK